MSSVEVFLERLADEGVAVEYKRLGGLAGGFDAERRIVWIDPSLSERELACTLAHEYVHVQRGHIGRQSKDVECRVDEGAARLLIDMDEYRQAERVYGSHPYILAEELGVLPRYVTAFQRTLTGGSSSRLSCGQRVVL